MRPGRSPICPRRRSPSPWRSPSPRMRSPRTGATRVRSAATRPTGSGGRSPPPSRRRTRRRRGSRSSAVNEALCSFRVGHPRCDRSGGGMPGWADGDRSHRARHEGIPRGGVRRAGHDAQPAAVRGGSGPLRRVRRPLPTDFGSRSAPRSSTTAPAVRRSSPSQGRRGMRCCWCATRAERRSRTWSATPNTRPDASAVGVVGGGRASADRRHSCRSGVIIGRMTIRGP